MITEIDLGTYQIYDSTGSLIKTYNVTILPTTAKLQLKENGIVIQSKTVPLILGIDILLTSTCLYYQQVPIIRFSAITTASTNIDVTIDAQYIKRI